MTKTRRQATILRLIGEAPIVSQDQLREALSAEGIVVTQATLSRDLRELGIVKTSRGSEPPAYSPPEAGAPPPGLDRLLPSLVRRVDGLGAFLVIRTAPAAAGLVATALDQAGWDELLGTIAGDDTVLVIARGAGPREAAAQRIAQLVAR